MASGLTSPPKVLQIFIALKNPYIGPVWTRVPWVKWQAH
jgi:hypothetical protein